MKFLWKLVPQELIPCKNLESTGDSPAKEGLTEEGFAKNATLGIFQLAIGSYTSAAFGKHPRVLA